MRISDWSSDVCSSDLNIDGELGPGVTAKDIILAVIGRIGTAGGTGYVMEYTGSAIRGLSLEGRMTVCNMSIHTGPSARLLAPHENPPQYIRSAQLRVGKESVNTS